ncbi:MAG: alpha-hydroxy-acid oxidizing protein [Treponema sp.]|nr:alpha-hydroxy-acid oxidizing protein [Treponema sp.]
MNELPGLGGVFDNHNFISNVRDWDIVAQTVELDGSGLPRIRLAPMTGAVQNMGYDTESPYYGEAVRGCLEAGIALCIGDGYPDEKLLGGIAALKNHGAKGAVFIKPYPNEKILERMAWAAPVAELVGIDIDSYNILTMRNLVNLEKKDAQTLRYLKEEANKAWGLPFAIKGVFTQEDLALVEEVKPDVVVVSNHGGRIETERGSTARFLLQYGAQLKQYTGALWVDGGLRTRRHFLLARALGAQEALVGRPLVIALLRDGPQGIVDWYRNVLA